MHPEKKLHRMGSLDSDKQRDRVISRRFIILGGIVLILAILMLLTSRNDNNRIFNVETVYDTVFVAKDSLPTTDSVRVVARHRTSIPKNPWRGHSRQQQKREKHPLKPNLENCRLFADMVSGLFSTYYYTPLSVEHDVDLLYEACRGDSTHTFGVVCRWFSNCPTDGVEWCCADSLSLYGTSSAYPVFLVLGIGGSPESPESMYILRAWTLRNALTPNFLSKAHRKTPGRKFYYKPEGPWLN